MLLVCCRPICFPKAEFLYPMLIFLMIITCMDCIHNRFCLLLFDFMVNYGSNFYVVTKLILVTAHIHNLVIPILSIFHE